MEDFFGNENERDGEKDFFGNEIERVGWQLFVDDLHSVISFYGERYGISPLAKRLRILKYNPYGDCPRCMRTARMKNIYRANWGYCPKCRVRWLYGENLISSWKDENEDIWYDNWNYLQGYEVV